MARPQPRSSYLRIEAPSATTALTLAESLEELRARAISEGGRWAVVVSLRGAAPGTVPEALSRTRDWLMECDVSTTSITLDGHTHLLRRDVTLVGR